MKNRSNAATSRSSARAGPRLGLTGHAPGSTIQLGGKPSRSSASCRGHSRFPMRPRTCGSRWHCGPPIATVMNHDGCIPCADRATGIAAADARFKPRWQGSRRTFPVQRRLGRPHGTAAQRGRGAGAADPDRAVAGYRLRAAGHDREPADGGDRAAAGPHRGTFSATGPRRRPLARYPATRHRSLDSCSFGGGIGLLLATGLVGAFRRLAPPSLPRAAEVSISIWPILFAIGAGAIVVFIVTIIPMWGAHRRGGSSVMVTGRGAANRDRHSRRVSRSSPRLHSPVC